MHSISAKGGYDEADGDTGTGPDNAGDACRRLRQQCDTTHPHACANSLANPNPFTDPCAHACFNSNTVPNSSSFAYSHPFTHAHPDPPCYGSSLGGPV